MLTEMHTHKKKLKDLHYMASFLCPSIKNLSFLSQEKKEQIYEIVLESKINDEKKNMMMKNKLLLKLDNNQNHILLLVMLLLIWMKIL